MLPLLGLFSEGAWPSARHVVGAACRVESTPPTGTDTQWFRVALQDLRQRELPSADHATAVETAAAAAAAETAAAAAGQQRRQRPQQHLFGPDFLIETAAETAADLQQGRQRQHLFGPDFLVGALQAFAESGMLGIRSVRLLEEEVEEAIQEPQELLMGEVKQVPPETFYAAVWQQQQRGHACMHEAGLLRGSPPSDACMCLQCLHL